MMSGSLPNIAFLHYSAPPVIGGVEHVILAHARLFVEAGYPTTIVAGRGEQAALPTGAKLVSLPELDSQQPQILELSRALDQGRVPANFEAMTAQITEKLAPVLAPIDVLLVHNVFTKHFNLPLTAALFRLLDQRSIRHCIAWCHDLTWTSPSSRSKVFPAYPWDLLRTQREDLTYVTVSQERQTELANLFGCPLEEIEVIYNGVDAAQLLALSDSGRALIEWLGLWESDLNLLMPVRVTQAKNIELAFGMVARLMKRGVRPRLVVTGPPDPHDPANMQYFQSLLALRTKLEIQEQARFVYESGQGEPLTLEMDLVGELLRVSDVLFMPSQREGFGMPVLEAGLAGIPIFCSEAVPAAKEIGGQDVVTFSPQASPDEVATLMLKWMEKDSSLRLRRRVRQSLTWQSLFRRQILPLLERGAA
jgi:glycosyltransferase involved in cell wall biosynthesis